MSNKPLDLNKIGIKTDTEKPALKYLTMSKIKELDELLKNQTPAIDGSYDTYPISVLNDQINLIYAATNVGKTTFTRQIAFKYAKQGKKVAILSTETSDLDNWRNIKKLIELQPELEQYLENIAILNISKMSYDELLEFSFEIFKEIDCYILDYVDGDRLVQHSPGIQAYQAAGNFIMNVRAELESNNPDVSCFLYSQVKNIDYYDHKTGDALTPNKVLAQNLSKLKGGSNPIMFSNSSIILFKDVTNESRYIYVNKFKVEGRDSFNFKITEDQTVSIADYNGKVFQCKYTNGMYEFQPISNKTLKEHSSVLGGN